METYNCSGIGRRDNGPGKEDVVDCVGSDITEYDGGDCSVD